MKYRPYHIELLEKEFQRRKSLNQRYSLRAFARSIGIEPSSLSRIFANKTDISIATAKICIKKLNLTTEERLMFISSFAEEGKIKSIRLLKDEFNLFAEDSNLLRDDDPSNSIGDESTSHPMFVIDQSGKCIYTNEAGAKMHNLTPAQIIGKTMQEIGTPDDIAKKLYACTDLVFKNNEIISTISSFPTSNGVRWYERKYQPMLGTDGKVQAVACHLKEITGNKSIEAKLKLMTKASEILFSSSDYRSNLSNVGALIIQDFADGCVIRLYEKKSSSILYVDHSRYKERAILLELIKEFPFMSSRPYEYHIAHQGKIVFVRKLEDELYKSTSINEKHESLLKSLDIGSLMSVPLSTDGNIIGTITVFRSKNRELYRREDVEMLTALGTGLAFKISD